MRKPPPVLGIALTVFIDILGFGLVIPDIQIRGQLLGASGAELGLVIASYSIAQFLVAPLLGRWSDVIGRRSVLLVTTLLSTTAYLFYSHAYWLWVMVVARCLGGMAGSNIGVAYAYIADVTSPENRSKAMGLIGAAFGMGFILGPAVGGSLVRVGHGSPEVLGYTSAAICFINFLYVLTLLPETRRSGTSNAAERTPTIQNFLVAIRTPGLGILLAMAFATNFGFSNMETTFFRLAKYNWWPAIHTPGSVEMLAGIIMAEVGIVMAIMQGGVIRIVIPKFGEVNALRFAYFCQIPALFLLPWTQPWVSLTLVVVLLGIGGGLTQPSLSGLISLAVPAAVQGGIFGVSQGLGALARIVGPIVGNTLFERAHWYPYAFAAGILVLPFLGALRLRQPSKTPDCEPEGELALVG